MRPGRTHKARAAAAPSRPWAPWAHGAQHQIGRLRSQHAADARMCCCHERSAHLIRSRRWKSYCTLQPGDSAAWCASSLNCSAGVGRVLRLAASADQLPAGPRASPPRTRSSPYLSASARPRCLCRALGAGGRHGRELPPAAMTGDCSSSLPPAMTKFAHPSMRGAMRHAWCARLSAARTRRHAAGTRLRARLRPWRHRKAPRRRPRAPQTA